VSSIQRSSLSLSVLAGYVTESLPFLKSSPEDDPCRPRW
jgi:hypothetical protein